MPKKTKKNRSELYDLCYRYMSDWEEENSEAMVAGANRILLWLNHHKNDTAHFKAAALYADENGSTGLHLIVDVDGVPFEVIDTWLKHAPETAQIKDEEGQLPLHHACLQPSLEVLMALVEAYPKSIEETDGYGFLPLHFACLGMFPIEKIFPLVPSLEVLHFLLKAYPESIDGKDNGDRTSYCLRRLADEEEGVVTAIIHEAVGDEMYLVVKLFVIACPRSALMPDDDGMVPLHHACSSTVFIDMAMVLLDAAPVSATFTDKWGRTPLQLLMPVAKLKDRHGMLPLHFQTAHSKYLTVNFLKFLIAAFPDSIDVQDDRGMLPFQYAFINKSLSVDVLMYFVEMNLPRLCTGRVL